MEEIVRITHPEPCIGVYTRKRTFEMLQVDIANRLVAEDVPENKRDRAFPVFTTRAALQRVLLNRILSRKNDDLNYVISGALREALKQMSKKVL
jgi:hypothetical protein